MKYLSLAIVSIAVCFVTSCKENKKESATESEMTSEEMAPVEASEVKALTVKMEPKSGSNVSGMVDFTEKDGVVTMTANIVGLTEGIHAIHIHEKADCSAPDGTSTGGHWNPTGQPHGKWGSSEGYHKGDIGNLQAGTDGKASISMSTDEWCIGCGDPNKDIVGKGIIVHAGEDDFVTQPTGNAGGRASCGGIIQ